MNIGKELGRKVTKWSLGCWLCILWVGGAAQPTSPPLITYFSPDVYKAAASNTCITQMPTTGYIYISNRDGILEYDGATWRLIEIPKRIPIYFLDVDPVAERVYVSALSELGYLEKDSLGYMQYHSLTHLVSNDSLDIEGQGETYVTSHGVYFSTQRNILRYKDGVCTVIGAGFFFKIYRIEDDIYTLEVTRPPGSLDYTIPVIKKVDGDSLVKVFSGPSLNGSVLNISSLGHQDQDQLMMYITFQGLFSWKPGEEQLNPISLSPDLIPYLEDNLVLNYIELADGRYAFYNLAGSLVILTPDLKVEQIIDQKSGLPEAEVSFLFEDQDQGLWGALGDGIVRIDLNANAAFWGKAQGLTGGVKQFTYYQDQVLLGNRTGVFKLTNPEKNGWEYASFKKESAIRPDFNEFAPLTEEKLFVAGGNGLQLIQDGEVAFSLDYAASKIVPYQKEQDFFFYWSTIGLEIMVARGPVEEWYFVDYFQEVDGEVTKILEDKQGNIWYSTAFDDIRYVKMKPLEPIYQYYLQDPSTYDITKYNTLLLPDEIRYDEAKGIPEGYSVIEFWGDQLIAGTKNGIKVLDTNRDRFIEAPAFGPISADTTFQIYHLAVGPTDLLWVAYKQDEKWGLGKLEKQAENEYVWTESLSPHLDKEEPIKTIFPDPQNAAVIWVGSRKGALKIDTRIKSEDIKLKAATIRSFRSNQRSLSVVEPSILPYEERSLSLEVGLPTYADPSKTVYQILLEGFHEDWPAWSHRSDVSFPNLSEGTYQLKVRAKDISGQISEVDHLTFTILPPWYRSWWAYSVYALTSLLTIVMLVYFYNRWRLRRILARNLELENVVEIRTEEIKGKNQELEQTLGRLKTTQDQLIMQEKMASLGQMTAGIAHEIKNPLNFVTNFAEGSVELLDDFREELDEAKEELKPGSYEAMNDLLEDVRHNTQKIQGHGERADAIVSSMMTHANDSRGERTLVSLNALLKDAVTLAYQGYLPESTTFSIDIQYELEEEIPLLKLNEQEISRVVINLVNNACDTLEQKSWQLGPSYSPKLIIRSSQDEASVYINVFDNGLGIPEGNREAIFTPFFTTKPTGKGNTGLGLSISFDIITQGYQGSLTVESEAGAFSKFEIRLPKER